MRYGSSGLTYAKADARLQGRCHERRKIANNTYLERRDETRISVQLHSTYVLTFHKDGRIDVNTGGWETSTTCNRIHCSLPNHACYSWRGVLIVSGNSEEGAANGARISPDGKLSADCIRELKEVRERVRASDNATNRQRSRERYWRGKARDGATSARLNVKKIMHEENVSVRACMMKVYGFERFMLDCNAQVIATHADYQLLCFAPDLTDVPEWRRASESITALKMVCPSTNAVYVQAVPPGTETVAQALDWIFDTTDYLSRVGQAA